MTDSTLQPQRRSAMSRGASAGGKWSTSWATCRIGV